MVKQRPFEIRFESEVAGHFAWIQAKYHEFVLDRIEQQLSHDPLNETRNRKPLAPPGVHGAEWELRLGPGNRFRVFYRVYVEDRVVVVAAVGVKDRNRLLIGGEEQ